MGVVAWVDRTPGPLRRLAYRIASGRGVLGRLADRVRFRYTPADIPVLGQVPDAPTRIFVGPANSSGQAFEWSHAASRVLPLVGGTGMEGLDSGAYLPQVDIKVPYPVYLRAGAWHDAFEDHLKRYTHVMWESGLPLLGRRYQSDVAAEWEVLRREGLKGALMFHGSDIRPPSLHAQHEPWSPFRDKQGPVAALEDTVQANSRLMSRMGVPVFVSTPDLLRWVPQATWCPVVIDMERWNAAKIARRREGPPVVVHAPTSPWLKGTALIEPILRRLDAEGVIEYRCITGVPHAAMPAIYGEADVVLDQAVLGIYGVAACEALAAGTLVMSHVDSFTRSQVQDRTGLDLPICEVTADTLEVELRRVAATPEEFDAYRAAGPAFVEAVHDGRRSAEALADFLGVSA